MIERHLKTKLRRIKLLALDFDGTLTDGFVYTDQDGKESVRTSRRDSLGLNALKRQGLKIIVISTEINNVVQARCAKLGVEVFSGVSGEDKCDVLYQYMVKYGITPEESAYMGDDINDIACLVFVGLAITVADGHASCRQRANYITKADGGNHAVREVCDMILEAKEATDE